MAPTHRLFARVCVAHCDAYTAPWPYGERTGTRFWKGEEIVCQELKLTYDGKYQTARTISGEWINVWCAVNKRHQEVGVRFCTLHVA